jgi:hypothetical protein
MTYQRAATFMRLTVSGPELITRNTYLDGAQSREANVDVFREDVTSHLRDYRLIARWGLYSGSQFLRTTRMTRNPILYVRTIDESNQQVDPALVDFVIATISSSIASLTGGRVALAGIERGPDQPPLQPHPGYLVVFWPAFDEKNGSCGSWLGSGPDGPTLSLVEKGCGCGGRQLDPGVIRHRLAHVLGLGDTPFFGDLMYQNLDYSQERWGYGGRCKLTPTPQEERYGRYLYSRPLYSEDPDDDPKFSILP